MKRAPILVILFKIEDIITWAEKSIWIVGIFGLKRIPAEI